MLKMKYRPRIYYSEAQKELMWDRWQKGDSMHTIPLQAEQNANYFGQFWIIFKNDGFAS
jgi:hypothetical protein